MPGASMPLLALPLLYLIGAASAQTAPLPPLPPFEFSTTFLWQDDAGQSLVFTGYQGDRGNSPVAFHTRRLDFVLNNGFDDKGGANGMAANSMITSLDVVLKTGSQQVLSLSFWRTMLAAAITPTTATKAGGSSAVNAALSARGLAFAPDSSIVSCAASRSLPSPFEALDWDFLELGNGGGSLLDLGNETIKTVFFPQGIVTRHWQSVGSCRDIWLTNSLFNPSNPQQPYSVPILFSVADASTSPACNGHNRTYQYANTTLLSEQQGSQTSALFSVPAACNITSSNGGGGNNNPAPSSGVALVWLIVGCLLCIAVGSIAGVIIGRRQVFSQLQATTNTLRNSYEQALVDAY